MATGRSSSPPAPGLAEYLGLMLREGRRLFGDYALLAVLDARHSAVQLAWLLSVGLVIAVLLVTAWLTAVTAALGYAFGAQGPWPGALLAAALLNVIGAGGLLVWMKGRFKELPFAATLRQLRGEEAPPIPARHESGTM